MKKIALFTLIGLCLLALLVRAQINLLHEFAGVVNETLLRRAPILSGIGKHCLESQEIYYSDNYRE